MLFKAFPISDLPSCKTIVRRLAILFIVAVIWYFFCEYLYQENIFWVKDNYASCAYFVGLLNRSDYIPYSLILLWIAAKMFNTFGFVLEIYICSLLMDVCAVELYYVAKNPFDANRDETFMVFTSVVITVVKCLLFVWKPKVFGKVKI